MKGSTLASSRRTIVCPLCEAGALRVAEDIPAVCGRCARTVEGELLMTLGQIVSLPDALGAHACECGHPEMRRLPDGVFHCPACGSEVVPPGMRHGGKRSARTLPERRAATTTKKEEN